RLRRHHGADLGRRRGARAAGDQERSENRTELAHQAQPDDRAERLRRAEALERVVPLESEHHADRETADADDEEREDAELVELVDDAADAPRRCDGIAGDLDEERRHAAEIGHHPRGCRTEAAEGAEHQMASGSASAASTSWFRNARTRASALARSSAGAP